MGPDLFNQTEPPLVVVTLDPCKPGGTDDKRTLCVRIKPVFDKSVFAIGEVDRYSPEWSVFRAMEHLMRRLTEVQEIPSRTAMERMLKAVIDEYVEPF